MSDSSSLFHRFGPAAPERPVIVSVPHAGRCYPDALLANARVARHWLHRLEDRYADALAGAVGAAGYTTYIADVARAWLDLNRDPAEWDAQIVHDAPPPGVSNGRVRAGLGLIPARLHPVGPLWRERMSLDALERRVDALHRPWHEAIGDSLSAARDRFGGALLIDLHSMPRQPGGTPQFVIGDRHGATVSSELAEHMLALAEGVGLKAARNMPYAGAYTVQRHGHVGSGIEAVQIEIDRSLYLGSDDMPHTGADEIARLILAIAAMAENAIHGTRWPMAAE